MAPGLNQYRHPMLSRPSQYVPEFHSSVIWAMKWRNLPRLWLFQMLHAHCRPRKYFRVLHVPNPNEITVRQCATFLRRFCGLAHRGQYRFCPDGSGVRSPAGHHARPDRGMDGGSASRRIKIADCDGRLWGVVAWEAKPGTDVKNPDPNLRSRPTLGMPILLWNGAKQTGQLGQQQAEKVGRADLQFGGRSHLFSQHQPRRSTYPSRAGMLSWLSVRRRKLDSFRAARRSACHSGTTQHDKALQCPQDNRQPAARGERRCLFKSAWLDYGAFP